MTGPLVACNYYVMFVSYKIRTWNDIITWNGPPPFQLRCDGFQVARLLTRPLFLIGMWSGEDRRANIIMTHVQNILVFVFEY